MCSTHCDNIAGKQHSIVVDHDRRLVSMFDMNSNAIKMISVLLEGVPIRSVLYYRIDG